MARLGPPLSVSPPNAALLDRLWRYCQISVAQTRGVHPCPFCDNPHGIEVERDGRILLLGTAEIRVFGEKSTIYAAPTLIYHYVAGHHYAPPETFVRAVLEGPSPGSPEYLARLENLGLDWNPASTGGHGFWDPSQHRPEDDDVPIIELMARAKRTPRRE